MIEVTTSQGHSAHYHDKAHTALAEFVISKARLGAVVTVTYHPNPVPDIAGRDL